MAKYKIEISEILPPKSGRDYPDTNVIYQQDFETDEKTSLINIIKAVNNI